MTSLERALSSVDNIFFLWSSFIALSICWCFVFRFFMILQLRREHDQTQFFSVYFVWPSGKSPRILLCCLSKHWDGTCYFMFWAIRIYGRVCSTDYTYSKQSLCWGYAFLNSPASNPISFSFVCVDSARYTRQQVDEKRAQVLNAIQNWFPTNDKWQLFTAIVHCSQIHTQSSSELIERTK